MGSLGGSRCHNDGRTRPRTHPRTLPRTVKLGDEGQCLVPVHRRAVSCGVVTRRPLESAVWGGPTRARRRLGLLPRGLAAGSGPRGVVVVGHGGGGRLHAAAGGSQSRRRGISGLAARAGRTVSRSEEGHSNYGEVRRQSIAVGGRRGRRGQAMGLFVNTGGIGGGK